MYRANAVLQRSNMTRMPGKEGAPALNGGGRFFARMMCPRAEVERHWDRVHFVRAGRRGDVLSKAV